jgi:3-methyladenine DNA glycosylase AlkD
MSKAKANTPAVSPALEGTLAELRNHGSEAVAAEYRARGAAGEVLGVKQADLEKLAKKIGTDQMLADSLWMTGGFDAQLLAAMIAEPAKADFAQLDRWAKATTSYPVADALGAVAGKSPAVSVCFSAWTTHRGAGGEHVHRCGWNALASGLANASPLGAMTIKNALVTIERSMKNAPNRVKQAMNGALISIGAYRDDFLAPATALAQKLGTVKIDHGDSGDADVDATSEMARLRAERLNPKAAKPAAKPAAAPKAAEKPAEKTPAKADKAAKEPAKAEPKVAAKPAAKAAAEKPAKAGKKVASK